MEKIIISNLEELDLWARQFVEDYLSKARKVMLYAPMGAGKTTFIKAVCKALGVEGGTSSPTFALVQAYPIANSELEVYHADLYRLETTEEAFDVGIEELFYDNNYLFIEWPELVEPLMPEKEVIYLRISVDEQLNRIFEVEIS
jgi:tRNA threonylcarbamoyladenosine biosynthesis protein TsaE